MERIVPNYDKNLNRYLVLESSSKYFLLDLKEKTGKIEIAIQDGLDFDFLLINYENVEEVHFDVPENVNVNVASLMHFDKKDLKITADVAKNSTFTTYFADFITSDCKGDITVNLNGEGAICRWHLASLTEKNEHKEFAVNIYHNALNTYSKMDNYGVVRDEAKLVFAGIGKISNGMHGSKAHQNAKIMVFDKNSNGIAKPVLKIDENDVEASHAAVVGKINDEHIFYLTSRGLTEDEAKRLITFGYLKPIIKGFEDEEYKEEIINLIEGKM
ncbi:MAG: SufD family Fe-S cluster assembly protein [Bacilli bacterium]|nr:SufD family Fe-S cluster assembly protein [Bacilli bacterium]